MRAELERVQSVNAGLLLEAASSSAAAAIPPPPPAVAILDRERLEARLDGLRVAVEEEEEENGVQVRCGRWSMVFAGGQRYRLRGVAVCNRERFEATLVSQPLEPRGGCPVTFKPDNHDQSNFFTMKCWGTLPPGEYGVSVHVRRGIKKAAAGRRTVAVVVVVVVVVGGGGGDGDGDGRRRRRRCRRSCCCGLF